MIFVIGGAYQGKTDFVREYFKVDKHDIIDGESCNLNSIYQAKVINHFHELIKRIMAAEDDLNGTIDKLINENKNVIIITTEIGCGLVPIDKFERHYRETVGRVCCKIAKSADQVYRLQCGLSTKIFDKNKETNTTLNC